MKKYIFTILIINTLLIFVQCDKNEANAPEITSNYDTIFAWFSGWDCYTINDYELIIQLKADSCSNSYIKSLKLIDDSDSIWINRNFSNQQPDLIDTLKFQISVNSDLTSFTIEAQDNNDLITQKKVIVYIIPEAPGPFCNENYISLEFYTDNIYSNSMYNIDNQTVNNYLEYDNNFAFYYDENHGITILSPDAQILSDFFQSHGINYNISEMNHTKFMKYNFLNNDIFKCSEAFESIVFGEENIGEFNSGVDNLNEADTLIFSRYDYPEGILIIDIENINNINVMVYSCHSDNSGK